MPKIKYQQLREYFISNMEHIPHYFNPAPHITYHDLQKNIQDDLNFIEMEMKRLQKRERILLSSPIRAAVGRLRKAYHYLNNVEPAE